MPIAIRIALQPDLKNNSTLALSGPRAQTTRRTALPPTCAQRNRVADTDGIWSRFRQFPEIRNRYCRCWLTTPNRPELRIDLMGFFLTMPHQFMARSLTSILSKNRASSPQFKHSAVRRFSWPVWPRAYRADCRKQSTGQPPAHVSGNTTFNGSSICRRSDDIGLETKPLPHDPQEPDHHHREVVPALTRRP